MNTVICYYCEHEFTAHKVYTKCPSCKRNFPAVYPAATLQMNRMGHIHMWPGIVTTDHNRDNPKVNGIESPIYFQAQSDIDSIQESLPPEQWDILDNGYTLYTHCISDEYFGE